MDSSSTSTGVIGTDSVIISYPERKVILGQGSFGVVFATRLGRARLAVKIVHCGKHWRRHHEKLEPKEYRSSSSSSSSGSSGNGLPCSATDDSTGGCLWEGCLHRDAFAAGSRWAVLEVSYSSSSSSSSRRRRSMRPQPQEWQHQPMLWSSPPGVDQAQA